MCMVDKITCRNPELESTKPIEACTASVNMIGEEEYYDTKINW